MDDMGFAYGKSGKLTLNDITIDIRNPQLISIIGPNGVGKSTLIHCMNKILEPTHGTVMVDDVDVKDIKVRDLAKKMGYVPYSSNDTFPLTVIDTILMGRNPHSKMRSDFKEDMRIVKEVLQLMDIVPLAMRPFNELSAGQHQKVVLARGIVRMPEMVILDEPTSNLDVRHQLEVTRILSELPKTNNMIIIMISHDINITAKYADKVIMLYGGTVFAVGTPKEVITKENMRTVYGVDADIIDIDGRPHVILNGAIREE